MLGETDAILHVDDGRHAVTSRHAHFVISWATVEGTHGLHKTRETMESNVAQNDILSVVFK